MEKNYDLFKIKVSFRNFINYSYIIVDRVSRKAAIIDPAWEFQTLTDKLQNLDVQLTTILLTHSHPDHVNLVEAFADIYDIRVFMSAKEIEYYHYYCKHLHALQDKEVVYLGETKISCILTPGHTAGSACYLLQGSVLTGDTVFIEGCGMCTDKGGSALDMFSSLQKLKHSIPLDTRVYPGHSYGKEPGLTFEYLLKNNIYFQFDDPESFVRFRMRKNQKNLFSFH